MTSIELLKLYFNKQIGFECLQENINYRYILEKLKSNKYIDFSFIDDFDTEEDIILWGWLYL